MLGLPFQRQTKGISTIRESAANFLALSLWNWFSKETTGKPNIQVILGSSKFSFAKLLCGPSLGWRVCFAQLYDSLIASARLSTWTVQMELGKDRAGDPALPICKESLENPPTLWNYGQAELCKYSSLWAGRQQQLLGHPSIEKETLLTEAGKAISALSKWSFQHQEYGTLWKSISISHL